MHVLPFEMIQDSTGKRALAEVLKANWVAVVLILFTFGSNSCKVGNKQQKPEQIESVSVAGTKGKPFIIELVAKQDKDIDTVLLLDLCKESNPEQTEVYRWKNHFVVYGNSSGVKELKEKFSAAFPGNEVKLYEDTFYEFNRSFCQDKNVAAKWDHSILTANLVEDTVLQKEYMDYHANQFKNWPEVSNGFCNASFQQLLLFRNGRQLMLVISIPKGASLDELNPKTTENNPRVDDWNSLMRKYQEGITGTKPGESWVFLEEIGNTR